MARKTILENEGGVSGLGIREPSRMTMTMTGTETSSAVSLVAQRTPHGGKAADYQLKPEAAYNFFIRSTWCSLSPRRKHLPNLQAAFFMIMDCYWIPSVPVAYTCKMTKLASSPVVLLRPVQHVKNRLVDKDNRARTSSKYRMMSGL